MKKDRIQTDRDKIRQINYRVFEQKMADAFEALEKAGLEPLLIKGWAASRYYPNPWKRNMGDVDIVFKPEYVSEAEVFLQDFTNPAVDIHSGLRHHDTVPLDDLYENCRMEDCHGTPVRVLRVEDHLRVLCVHWLTDSGAYKDKLWDIFYAIEQHREIMDWDRCLNVVSPIRKGWIVCVIGLAHRYLGLDIEDLPFRNEIKKIPDWVEEALEREWQSPAMLLPLQQAFSDKRLLYRQILKRFPPNPLHASIMLEKPFDTSPRVFYQIQNIFTRLKASVIKSLNEDKG